MYNFYIINRDISVCIATGWAAGVRFPVGVRDFSLLHYVQTGCGVHPDFYTMDTGALSAEVKRPGREAVHSHQSSAEVKNGGSPLPNAFSWSGD
jgi:hypothetical protein